jgi:hypothetical protein
MLRACTLFAAVVTALALPSTGGAATYTDSVVGAEIAFTSTQGTFVGKADGQLPGLWKAVVDHTPLSPNADITGGSFTLWALLNGVPSKITGNFDPDAPTGSDEIVRTNPGTGCTNETYAVADDLVNVAVNATGNGTGSFTVTLTHHRASFFGSCFTYAATVRGSLVLNL